MSQELADRFAIQDALFRYARGVDRCDWDLVRSVYHPDATDLHGSFCGGIDEFIRYLKARHEGIEQSIHFVTNVLVEFKSGSTALVESYYFCLQRLKAAETIDAAFSKVVVAEGETIQLQVAGRYIDWFEQRRGEWRIADRRVAFDVVEARATPMGGGLNHSLLVSRRDQGDALYQGPPTIVLEA